MVNLKKLVEKDELEEAGRGRPPKVSSTTIADKVDAVADPINAEDNVITSESSSGIIEDTLDRALVVNKRINKVNGDDYVNVLFVGEAGSGKSSRIRAWARKNGINLYEVRAAGMDDTDLGGAITPNKEGTVVNRLASTEFDALDNPNSVLFLDEYNRAPASVRTNLLELVNSHVVPDPREPSGQRKLKGFLFTVAAINPATVGYGTDEMDMAEKTRFRTVRVPSEKANLLNYLRYKFNNEIKQADDDKEWIKELKGKLAIAEELLKDKNFKFDEASDIEQTIDTGNGKALNSRSLTQLLVSCDGTKKDFLNQWDQFVNSLKKQMAVSILKDYKDIDDVANDALKGHETQSTVFNKAESNIDKINRVLSEL
jgi:hypothetical protein